MNLIIRHVLAVVLIGSGCFGREVQAGVAKIDITPVGPIWLSGYAVRNKPSEGVVHRIWAKAVAIEDGAGHRVVMVTTDLIGLPRAITDVVAARAAKQYGLDRAHLLLNSSHTHAGPVVRPNLMTMYELDATNRSAIDRYAEKLTDDLMNAIGAAIGDLAPARLQIGHGTTGFARNRRNPPGGVDHDVPVIAVRSKEGKLRAVLFGYACHNTTLPGEFYEVTGDYAGFAQYELEAMQPNAVAMFLMLCGGDANPFPRGKLSDAEAHGKELAGEVNRVLGGGMKDLPVELRMAWQTIQVPFAPHSREMFEEEARSTNRFKAARAREMLRAYDERRAVNATPYPLQAIRLGKGVAILALGGEVVVGYALRAKKEYGGTDLIVAGYSNDVMCYIPTKKVLEEGGYEGRDSMIYYGQPGPFSDEVEETIFTSIHTVLARVGIKAKR